MLDPVLMPPVVEDYQAYTAPRWVRKTVGQILDSLRPEHVAGLAAIVLTDSARIGKGRTKRVSGRKYANNECLGFYQPRHGQPASILLVVDNLVGRLPSWFWLLPLMRDSAIAPVLFHEVGHHLNATIGLLAAGEEASADVWKAKLLQEHVRRKWRWLGPIQKPVLRTVVLSLRAVGEMISPAYRRSTARRQRIGRHSMTQQPR